MEDFNFSYLALEPDLHSIPDACAVLRRLAELLLQALLEHERRPPVLGELLSLLDARALMDIRPWKFKGPGIAPRKRRKEKSGLAVSLRELIIRSIDGEVQPREWQLTFQQRLMAALADEVSESGLPVSLESLLEVAAWQAPRFKRFAAVVVMDYQRERELLVPGKIGIPTFSAGVFWALIGLVETGKGRGEKQLPALLATIREEARLRAMKKNLANTWDQWMIMQAFQRWPQAFRDKKNEFIRFLLELPKVAAEGIKEKD